MYVIYYTWWLGWCDEPTSPSLSLCCIVLQNVQLQAGGIVFFQWPPSCSQSLLHWCLSPEEERSTTSGIQRVIFIYSSSSNSFTLLSSLPHSLLLSLFCSCFWTLFLCLLQVPPTEFRDVQTDCPLSDLDQPAEEELKLHRKSHCLKCRLFSSPVCQFPKDACSESMHGVENSPKQSSSEERVAVRKEALKLVSKLSGDIAAKATKQGLKMYSEVFAFKCFV